MVDSRQVSHHFYTNIMSYCWYCEVTIIELSTNSLLPHDRVWYILLPINALTFVTHEVVPCHEIRIHTFEAFQQH